MNVINTRLGEGFRKELAIEVGLDVCEQKPAYEAAGGDVPGSGTWSEDKKLFGKASRKTNM